MTRPVGAALHQEVVGSTTRDSAYPNSPVPQSANRTAAEVAARLLRIAEDLARVAAEVVVTIHAQTAPTAVQPARTAWTAEEFAKSMGLHIDTVKRLLRSGDLRGFKVNGKWQISEDARREYIAKREQITAEELGLAS